MKKLMSALLAAAMVFTMGTAVFAEDADPADAGENIKSALSGTEGKLDAEQRDLSQYAMSDTDTVTVNGNQYIVNNGNVTMELNLDPSLGLIVLTRDFVASIESYFMFNEPETVWQTICDYGVNFYMISQYTGAEYAIDSFEPDALSAKFGTLSEQPEQVQEAYLSVFAQAAGATASELFKAGNNVFFRLEDGYFFPFVGGNMIRVMNISDQPMTEEELQDLGDLLAGFTFTAN